MGERTMNKRLCILQITPEKPNPVHISYFKDKPDCDFFFLTHDAEHPDALKFCPNTVWSETRNIIVESVPKKYDYYGFVDYDWTINSRSNLSPRDQILEDLDWNPAVLTYYPGKGLSTPYATDTEYLNSRERSCIPFTHASFKMIHHSLLNWFFPMHTKYRVDIDGCHMFNIQEIPFLKNVICSHKMTYDNDVSVAGAYNKNPAFAKQGMDQMWKDISTSYKHMDALRSANYDLNDSLSIKYFYVNLFKQLNISPEKSPGDVNYLDVARISQHFDIEHPWIASHIR
jgi:hypothetical protein|tara:strand:- start:820 stop:1677 length:858 start_codon:yes stop_codon:yes gene_type:complete